MGIADWRGAGADVEGSGEAEEWKLMVTSVEVIRDSTAG